MILLDKNFLADGYNADLSAGQRARLARAVEEAQLYEAQLYELGLTVEAISDEMVARGAARRDRSGEVRFQVARLPAAMAALLRERRSS